MTVRELLAILAKANPDLEVEVGGDNGPMDTVKCVRSVRVNKPPWSTDDTTARTVIWIEATPVGTFDQLWALRHDQEVLS